MFVFSSAYYTPEEIAKFASLIPLPDVIVYVRAPIESLIRRSLQRVDPPREMRSKNRAQIETYVNRAVTMFEHLVKVDEIRDRVLIVENPEIADREYDKAVDDIAEFVLNYESSHVG
jgi:thymidylate kinase